VEVFKQEKLAANAIISIIASLLIFLPPALGFLYVHQFGVNVPYWDQWWFVPLFEKLSTGTLGMSDLWFQNNEHRILFPRIVMLLLGDITKYNNVAEMYLTQGFLLVVLIALLLAFKSNVKTTLFLFIPISFLIFSPRQHENMLWGFQMGFVIVVTFSVLALSFLYVSAGHKRFKEVAFLAALLSATVASFSSAQGLLVWLAGLLQLSISPVGRSNKKYLTGVWTLIGLGEWIVYFIGWTKPHDGQSLSFAFNYPLAGIEYFLTLVGSSLFWQQNLAFIGGLLLICLVIVSLLLIYKNKKLDDQSFWIALLFLSFLIMASITIGRAEGGAAGALISRYTTFSILAVVSAYAMLIKLVLERKSSFTTALFLALSALVLLSIPMSYTKGIEEGEATRASREQAAFILSTYEAHSDELLVKHLCPTTYGCVVHPFGQADTDTIREQAGSLKRLGYNVFS
jgi:hypothetical protein